MIDRNRLLRTYEDYLHEVRKITYKPGFAISWGVDSLQQCLCMICNIPVVCPDTGGQTTVTTSRKIPIVPRTLEQFLLEVRWSIMDWEMHEMSEWLKFDGVCVEDPHPNGDHQIKSYRNSY